MNMELSYRREIEYPEWHKKPFRLSVEEMENPYLVLEEFFEAYNLIHVRAFLCEWLTRSMDSKEPASKDLFNFYRHVERLVEAAGMIQNKRK